MKKLLTIAVTENGELFPDSILFEGAELIKRQNGESAEVYFKRLFKCADGKYVCFCGDIISLEDFYGFLNALDGCNADALIFDGGVAFKTATVKSANFSGADARCAEVAAFAECKTISRLALSPYFQRYTFKSYSEEYYTSLLGAIENFARAKSRMTKEIYTSCFDVLSTRAAQYLAAELIAVREGAADVKIAESFHGALTAHKVLYLAIDKKLDIKGGLDGVAADKFKVSSGVAKKLTK